MPIPGSERTISAADQARALGLDATAPKPAPLARTPNQARRAMSDEYIGEDLNPPDWEASVVSDPEAIANALGLRPQDFDAAPLGSQPEGMPIAQPDFRPTPETRAEKVDWESIDAARPPSATDRASPAAKLAADTQKHVGKVIARAVEAQASGTPDQIRRAESEAAKTRAVAARIAAGLGLREL